MIKSLSDYRFLHCIHNDGIISLHHALCTINNASLILKLPANEAAPETAVSFLKNEYAVCSKISIERAIRAIRFVRINNSCVVEHDNIDVVPLAFHPCYTDRSLPAFIATAIDLAQLVGCIHDAGIVHRNCSPFTFLKSLSSGIHFLTGFYVATLSASPLNDKSIPLYYPPNCYYIAPEQTGNIDRSTDERTDMYALGAIFYEMLSGEPPFMDSEPASLLYSHVAREPVPVNLKNSGVPCYLADIVSKLLKKNPAERYQSSLGLIADLEECRSRLTGKATASTPFFPGARDRITRLLPIKKLYGRNKALKDMNEAFLSAYNGRASAVFISGPAGVGKTSLVDAFFRSIDRPGVLFARGKCDSSSTNIPYHALKRALADLIREIISHGNEDIDHWRDLLLDSIGYNREIVAEFIPEIQMIIGPCRKRDIPADAIAGTQFKNVFIRLCRTFIQKSSALVLFIDDLQWADSALSAILRPAFFETTDCRLLFIGAQRNISETSDPLIANIGKSDLHVMRIDLASLTPVEARQMIADSLGTQNDDLQELEEIIFTKTGGNPLFLKGFLEMLLSRRLLVHTVGSASTDPSGYRRTAWKWDSAEIRALECTENVVDIVLDKVTMLSSRTRRLLEIGSCIGMRLNVALIGAIDESVHAAIEMSLSEALDAGILQYGAFSEDRNAPREFRFSHDRIREAIYNKIDHDERIRLHLSIGRTLLRLKRQGSGETPVFDIVKHFNPFQGSISDADERMELAALNLEAADRSRNASAVEIAIEYLNSAIQFLPSDAWTAAQEIRFNCELSLAKCEYMLCRMDESLRRLTLLAGRAVHQRQLASIDLVRMLIYHNLEETARSIEIGFNRLKAMGVNLPKRPSIAYLVVNFCRAALAIRSIIRSGDGSGLTEVTVPETVHYSFSILGRLWLYAFTFHNQRVAAAIVTHLILRTRVYGRFGAGSVAICFWGILVGMLTRNPLKGLRYGTLALSIAKHSDDLFSRGITYFLYGSFFAHLVGHLDSTLELLAEGQRCSHEADDINSASNSAEGYVLFMALSGKPLKDVRRCATESIRFLELIGITTEGTAVIKFIRLWAENLENRLNDDKTAVIAQTEKEYPLVKGIILLLSLFASTVAGDHRASLRLSHELKGNPLLDPTSYFFNVFTFLHALAISSSYGEIPLHRCNRLLKGKLSVLKKSARRSPVNMRHLFLLVTAEHHRINKRRWEALHSYRQAIEAARQHNFLHHAALAAERAASFMKPYDIEESRTFLRTAISLYTEWGSSAKAAMLKREAPDVPFYLINRYPLLDGSSEIDVQALLKSFEAITDELNLDRLLEKLIRIVMENAGAQRGVLLLEDRGAFFVRVEGKLRMSDTNAASYIESNAVNMPSERFSVPQGIISYVQRSREAVRLENAAARDRFVHDPYVKKNNIRSVLCAPLVNKERVRGIIYLENNIMEAAFPPSRLLLLKILCGQAIVSIENALFHDIEIKHLQSKINPHFLYNALSSIAELCHSDPEATEDAVIKLSTIYRYVLTAGMHLVTLEEELEIVNKYLAIEKLRFGDRLSYNVRITGDPSLVCMPCMLIQPLVENSIKHGITTCPSGGTITITIIITDKRCSVTVEDDGKGPNKSAPGTGYGLHIIRKRLEMQYSDDAVLEINDVAGFKVHFSIPLVPQRDQQ